VVELDRASNRVVVGDDVELRSHVCNVRDINWMSFAALESPIRVSVKIRHRHEPAEATVEPLGETSARIQFDEPQRAITPGQAAVFYSGDVVLGGGWIR
jgi:tRNA-specific 2-thiouridylase